MIQSNSVVSQLNANLVFENGLFFSRKKSKISYPDDGNDIYAQIESDSFWFKHRNEIITSYVKKYAKDAVFFDIGGGNGFVAKGLENAGIETVLIEPGLAGALNAKKRGVESVVCSTLEDAEFKQGTLSSVGLFDVVEHINDDKQFMSQIYELQKPGAFIFVSVPAYNWLWSDEDIHAGHFRRRTLKSIGQLLQDCGYQIQLKSYFFSILVFPIFLFRSLPYRLGFRRKENNINTLQKEHGNSKSLFSNMINFLLKLETKRVQSGKKIGFGSSCFVIARKEI